MNEGQKPSNEEGQQIKVVKGIDLINLVKNEPEPKFLWKGIPEGSTGLITGVAKTGKTTFAENLAISISVGRKEFFGFKIEGGPKKVLFINLEESYRLRSRRNQKQISRLNQDELQLFSENYISTPVDFPDFINTDEDWNRLQEYIIASEAEVVFIDSLTHMFSGKIEDSTPSRRFTENFSEKLSVLNKTIIIVHHNTKGNERPIDQDSIAGSRVILQFFQYAWGMANIPTANGGNYLCMLNNKFIEKDDTKALLYKMSGDGWVEYIKSENKFSLYQQNRKDNRKDNTNRDLVYSYLLSQHSKGSQTISSTDLHENFVSNDTMSKDTLYKKITTLEEEGVMQRLAKGIYSIKFNTEDGYRA
ncbi:AAA family ATPase [Maribacter arcticus]|uniref:AAA family ATPase n=1 Tax=Maribacter arcticus TaxID=561365 RepID=UPI0030023EC6